jgi:uncharacterized protein involved in type VI secretion and phage assembly
MPPDPGGRLGAEGRARLFGVYPAVVTDVLDPNGQGRVQIRLPWVDEREGDQARVWARLATMMAGDGRGTWFVPEPGDEVLISFMGGDPRHPVVMGALWNGQDSPPESMGANNDLRSITSRAGHRLTFDDSPGAGRVVLETAQGHTLRLEETGGGLVTLEHTSGAKIVLDVSGAVSITATSQVHVSAPAGLNVSAGQVNLNTPMVICSGTVQVQTLLATMVSSATYTPGAGNVW